MGISLEHLYRYVIHSTMDVDDDATERTFFEENAPYKLGREVAKNHVRIEDEHTIRTGSRCFEEGRRFACDALQLRPIHLFEILRYLAHGQVDEAGFDHP